jgi:hypothetical protein
MLFGRGVLGVFMFVLSSVSRFLVSIPSLAHSGGVVLKVVIVSE